MTLKTKPVFLYTFPLLMLLVAGKGTAATPMCSSTEFDTDGDGWGWENHQSCLVTSDTVVIDIADEPDPAHDEPAYKDRHPVCTGINPDPDGDGWGWENYRPCYTDDSIDADLINIDVDTDADSGSSDDAVVYDDPVCELASSDPDGDGWGWENSRSCIVVVPDDDNIDDLIEDSNADTDAGGDAGDEVDDGSADDTDADGGSNSSTDADNEKTDTSSPIVFKQDFESAENGLYQSDQLNEAWNRPFWHLGFDQGRVRIVSDSSGGKIMQVTFPAGAYGSNGASAFLSDVQFGMELPKTYDELYLTYDLMFDEDFQFVLGGKLPGLCGANSDSALTEGCNTGGGKPTGFDGWSARGMWRVDGALEHYTYHAGQQNYWADSHLWNVKAQRGTWHRVQHRVVLNNVGARDGVLEAWIDGRKVLSQNDIEYRKTESVGINLFYFSTFFGGNDPSWAPDTDQTLYFDNFVISTVKTD